MGKTMSPSETVVTAEQIGKIQELLGAGLRKAGLPSEAVQIVIEQQGKSLVADLVAVVRNRVDAVSKMIIRKVKVDRTKTPQQMLDATGRKQYTDRNAVDFMPRGTGEDVKVMFFKPEPEEYTRPGYMSDDDLEKAFDRRGLRPDPYAQAKANWDDPTFADNHPNGIHWKDADGKWYFATFDQWGGGERSVGVDRFGDGWYGRWWFAGVCK